MTEITTAEPKPKKTSTSTTSRKKTITAVTSYSTASGTQVVLRCSDDFVKEIDLAIEDLYNRYNGYEIAAAIGRYRQRVELKLNTEKELVLLAQLKNKYPE